jgi:hypothetical protein
MLQGISSPLARQVCRPFTCRAARCWRCSAHSYFMRESYALAIRERYRFYSFGDAMLIL